MFVNVGETVYPGDILKNLKSLRSVTIVGPGLRRNDDGPNTLLVTQVGKLHFKEPNTYWVEGDKRRYIPKKGDHVVGIVAKKAGDTLRVDIGASEYASLSMLAFEGATKKQKPDVQVGDLIYAKLLNAHKEMEPELVCIDSYYKAGKLGVLSNDGFLTNINIKLVHRLLNPDNPLLRTLGKKYVYEIAIGMNGKVWIKGKSCSDVLKIVQVLQCVEYQSDKNVLDICRQIK